MEIDIIVILLCAVVYLIAGFVDAIAGGGGLITIPSLMLFNIPPHYALGTNKFACSLGSLTAIWPFLKNKLIALHLVPIGFTAAFVGGAFGSWLALQVSPSTLGTIMAILLPMALVCSLFSGHKKQKAISPKKEKIYMFFIAFLIGTYDGFFGPGTGSFFIIALNMFLGMELVRASGSTKVFNLASNVGALATFASGGVVLYALAIPCAIGSIVGNQLGARLAIKIGVKLVRTFLYVALSLLFGTLLYKYILA